MKVNYFGFLAILASVGVAGCITEPPYVDRPYQIDRRSKNFPLGPKLVVGSEVTVCYAKSASSPQEIRQLADDECGRFGLGAALYEQTLEVCPLRAPVAAVFKCAELGTVGTVPAVLGSVPMIPAFAAPGATLAPSSGLGAADVSTTAKSAPFPVFLFNKGTAGQ